MKQQQLPPSNPLEGTETAHIVITEQPLGVLAAEAPDHTITLFRIAEYVNRNRVCGLSLPRDAHRPTGPVQAGGSKPPTCIRQVRYISRMSIRNGASVVVLVVLESGISCRESTSCDINRHGNEISRHARKCLQVEKLSSTVAQCHELALGKKVVEAGGIEPPSQSP